MADAVPGQGDTYREFVREVFIDPIRTVTVIDDEFPTLDGLLAARLDDAENDVADQGLRAGSRHLEVLSR